MTKTTSRMLYPVDEATDVLGGMSRSTLYEQIKAGLIETVKVGRRTYISHRELERYVDGLNGRPEGRTLRSAVDEAIVLGDDPPPARRATASGGKTRAERSTGRNDVAEHRGGAH